MISEAQVFADVLTLCMSGWGSYYLSVLLGQYSIYVGLRVISSETLKCH